MKNQIKLVLMMVATFSMTLFTSCEKDFLQSEQSILDQYSGEKKPGTTVSRNALKMPTEVAPNGLSLTAAPGTSNLGGGHISDVWAFNGSFPSPTIRATSGSNASIVFQNNLPEQSIVHWHGMIVNPANDGQPSQAVPGGSSYSYNFPINQRAYLGFYHPHPHHLTGKQVYNGLAGAFIVNDAEEAALNLPSGAYEIPLIVRDATLDRSGNMEYKPKSGGFLGKIPLVNGTMDPYLEVSRAVYRFRVVNAANSRIFDLNLSNGQPFVLIGNDGGLLPSSSNQPIITISNGERIDILLDFRQMSNGSKIMLKDARSGWDLLEFRVTGNQIVNYNGPMSTTSSTVVPLSNPVVTRYFSFDGMNKINGNVYDMTRIDWTVPFGQTEKWVFTTNGNAPHPVHVHGVPFQVISRTGGRGQLYPWEMGWKDTVLLENNETVEVLIRFDAFTGKYLMHCHKLEHEDMGMMANFEVVN